MQQLLNNKFTGCKPGSGLLLVSDVQIIDRLQYISRVAPFYTPSKIRKIADS